MRVGSYHDAAAAPDRIVPASDSEVVERTARPAVTQFQIKLAPPVALAFARRRADDSCTAGCSAVQGRVRGYRPWEAPLESARSLPPERDWPSIAASHVEWPPKPLASGHSILSQASMMNSRHK